MRQHIHAIRANTGLGYCDAPPVYTLSVIINDNVLRSQGAQFGKVDPKFVGRLINLSSLFSLTAGCLTKGRLRQRAPAPQLRAVCQDKILRWRKIRS